MLDEIGCVQRDLLVWKDGRYDSVTIRTFSLYMGGFFGLDLTWIWNLNSKKKIYDRMISKYRQNQEN